MWAKLDDHYHDNPKMLSVSIQARWIHTAAISWCSEHLTDGVIPRRQAWKLGAEDESSKPGEWIQELIEANLFEVAGPQAYRVHDFLDCNPSRAEVEARHLATLEQRRAAGKKRAEGASRDDQGCFAAGESAMPTSEAPADNQRVTSRSPPGHQREHQRGTSPVPVPVPVPDPEKLSSMPPPVDNSAVAVDNLGRNPRSHKDSSVRSRSRKRKKPEAENRFPRSQLTAPPANERLSRAPPGLSEHCSERLDELRRQILATEYGLRGHAQAIDRIVIHQVRNGVPSSVIEQGLLSLLERRPREPAAYLAKILRIEVQNHHEAANIAKARAEDMTPLAAHDALVQLAALKERACKGNPE